MFRKLVQNVNVYLSPLVHAKSGLSDILLIFTEYSRNLQSSNMHCISSLYTKYNDKNLNSMFTPPLFSIIFTKGVNFCDSCLLLWMANSFQNGIFKERCRWYFFLISFIQMKEKKKENFRSVF